MACYKSTLTRLIIFCETRVEEVTKIFKEFVASVDTNKIGLYKDDNLFLLSSLETQAKYRKNDFEEESEVIPNSEIS